MTAARDHHPAGGLYCRPSRDTAPPEEDPPGVPPSRREKRTGWRRRRRWVALLIVALLVPVTVSYIRALTYPGGNASVLVRTVEWVRDHGGAPW